MLFANATSCMVSHAFHWGPEPFKLLHVYNYSIFFFSIRNLHQKLFFSICHPPFFGFPLPNPTVEGKPRRVQKGDAQFVAVFTTSKLGVRKYLGDIDVIVNDAIQQPECHSDAIGCNHAAALTIREWIIKIRQSTDKYGTPWAYSWNTDKFVIDMMNSPLDRSGKFFLFTTNKKSTKKFDKFARFNKHHCDDDCNEENCERNVANMFRISSLGNVVSFDSNIAFNDLNVTDENTVCKKFVKSLSFDNHHCASECIEQKCERYLAELFRCNSF